MRLIKHTHACVRLEDGDRALVIDPGVWAEPQALEGANDVLVTHEHYDHFDADKLSAARAANPGLTVYAGEAVAGQLSALGDAVVTVSVGDRFTAAGFEVRVVGGRHAEIYEGLPGCANLGYIVDGGLYHPGDALFPPDADIDTLLVPAAAPWLKLAEALDFVREVKPRRAYPIHDATLSEIGQDGFDNWVRLKGGTDYARIPVGGSVVIG
jgi:L-ascorbate metabolism protein UlaG (beta-lactamase superfamily)